jgi:large subunit ribosomal protein L21e
MKRSKGKLSRKSRILGKNIRRRRATVSDIMKQLDVGSRVQIVPYAKFEDFPHPRYVGKVGTIIEKRGRAYIVELFDGDKKKHIITSAVHLKIV